MATVVEMVSDGLDVLSAAAAVVRVLEGARFQQAAAAEPAGEDDPFPDD